MGLWPYIELVRLEKPTGSLLMFWPFAWGLTMAAHRTHLSFEIYVTYLVQFAIYAILLRGVACTVNDILDVKYDAAVERTKSRPLPSERISVRSALIFLVFQYVISVTFLTLTLPTLGLSVALVQLLPVFAIYPLLKRITYWPQAWLGIAMNLGFPVAWTTITGTFEYWVVIPALMGCWCWTMLYDTIYACQDIRDDVKAGVRSTAILFGEWIRPLLVLCGAIFLQMLIVVGYLNGHGPIYYVITVGGTALHLGMQCKTVNLTDPNSCWRNFNYNGRLGFLIWAGLLMDYHNHLEHFAFPFWCKGFWMVS
ncbi:UbiA prenyltransferase family [Panaeolus papilionaceus]|nr:UbiA prenyltransferase family [Panaeolus papilionaceus]